MTQFVIFAMTQEDDEERFRDGLMPMGLLRRAFDTQGELDAYRDGFEASWKRGQLLTRGGKIAVDVAWKDGSTNRLRFASPAKKVAFLQAFDDHSNATCGCLTGPEYPNAFARLEFLHTELEKLKAAFFTPPGDTSLYWWDNPEDDQGSDRDDEQGG